jgi:AmmeMemoRadiSam system protein B/AmmeMemoRadiSam system protein A
MVMIAAHVSTYAGSWYPGQAAKLDSLLKTLFEDSAGRTGEPLPAMPLALIVPHAGLAYSGTVAAAAYRQLQATRPARVILLGFLHRGGEPGVFSPAVESYETPLGRVPVDLAGLPFPRLPVGRATDHSVEIQLPLLLQALPGIPIAPLYVGCLSSAERAETAAALAAALRPGDVLVASTDLTHYGRSFGFQPFPLDEQTADNLHEMDRAVIEAAGSLDDEILFEELRRGGSTTCGRDPVALLLKTLQQLSGGEIFQTELDYQTSGDITGDYGVSVGYAALGYFRASTFELAEEDRQLLLKSAHDTLCRLQVTGEELPQVAASGRPALRRRAGVFVSLHLGKELLGCIGRLDAHQPLAQAVPELVLSALHDPRFPARSQAPQGVEVEISVLSPMKRVPDASRFVLREHGALLECWGHRGLLLPQVARGRECTSEWFLNALAQKAGLPKGAWRERGARLSVFRAQVFSSTS